VNSKCESTLFDKGPHTDEFSNGLGWSYLKKNTTNDSGGRVFFLVGANQLVFVGGIQQKIDSYRQIFLKMAA